MRVNVILTDNYICIYFRCEIFFFQGNCTCINLETKCLGLTEQWINYHFLETNYGSFDRCRVCAVFVSFTQKQLLEENVTSKWCKEPCYYKFTTPYLLYCYLCSNNTIPQGLRENNAVLLLFAFSPWWNCNGP